MFGKKKGSDTEDKEIKKAKKEKKPRKEKKQKEPRQKKEKKQKEPKKAKPPKKPKPPKRPKPKKPKKPKKKMNPLILVIILLAVMVAAAAGALVMMMKQREKEEDDMYGPMFYFTEEDGIESIRSKIGDREIKGGYKPPVDMTAETPEPEEDKEKEKDKEKEDAGEDLKGDIQEESEEEEDPELAEVDIKLLTDQHLSYITPGDGIKEAEAYITYLVQEKGFKVLTYPEGSEGEIPKEAPQPTQAEKEDKDEDKKEEVEEETEEEFIPPEAGYYIAALDNADTVEEGTPAELKRVRMEYTYDSYTLRLSIANGEVNDLIPPEPEEETGPQEVTLSTAVQTLQGMASGILKLPKPTAEYEMTPIQGRIVLEGIDFFNVRAYEKGPDDTVIFGGAYYVSSDGGSVYKHDEMTGEITCISGEDILAQARQQNRNIEVNKNAAVLSGNQ